MRGMGYHIRMSSIILGLVIAIILFALLRFAMGAGVPRISGPEARKLVSEGALFVDVRNPPELQGGRNREAKNIPLGDLKGRMGELGSKDRPIILCCASGTRSAMAGRMLKSAGYTKVYNLGPWHRYPSS